MVKEKKVPTIPIKPIRVEQALQRSGKPIVNRKVRSHVHFTNKDYTSKEEVDLLVAPLNTDVTLGMPMLQQEGIVVDAANRDIVTPKTEVETKDKSMQLASLHRIDPNEIKPTHQERSPASRTHANVPTIMPEMARNHHAEGVKEFSDVFYHKTPTFNSRNRPKDAPYHRIQLKDPSKSINGRMFALPERYMNWMIKFIEHHLLAGHI